MDSERYQPATIAEALRHNSRRYPSTEFIVTLERSMTYADVDRASSSLARRMLGAGVGKGTRVGLFFTNGPEWATTWLAITRIGALAVPLSTVSSPAEVGTLLGSSDVHLLIATPSILGKTDVAVMLETAIPHLTESASPRLYVPETPMLRNVWFAGEVDRPWATSVDLFSADLKGDPDDSYLQLVESKVSAADPAVVIHTSGSTAEPKGVVHSHGAVLRQSAPVVDLVYAQTKEGLPAKVLTFSPFFWVGGLLFLAGALSKPMGVVTMPKPDAAAALELIEKASVTSVSGWAHFLRIIREHPDFDRRDLSSIRDQRTLGNPIVQRERPAHFGMSETMGSFAHVEKKVIDRATGRKVPAGEEGELCIRGPGAMLGYYNKERHAVFDGDGWYHTGDRVSIGDDQIIYYSGRYSEMIKSAGANVSPREVELALEELDEVDQCFVFGMPHPVRDEEVVAMIVPAPSTSPDIDTIRSKALSKLSTYKVPTRFVVIAEESLPRLGTGKVDKRRLIDVLSSEFAQDA